MAYNTIAFILISTIVGYFIGSIPFSIIIGKVFYHTDVRDYGSKNAGGTNVGRVLGKKAAYTVIVLDILKNTFCIWLTYYLAKSVFGSYLYDFNYGNQTHYEFYSYLVAVTVSLGHCFPVFCDFKGGKTVTCFLGFLLATNYYLFILSLIIFFALFFYKHIASYASCLTSLVIPFCALSFGVVSYYITNDYLLGGMYFSSDLYFSPDFSYFGSMILITLLLLYRHKENIVRLINHTEPITRYKKGK